MKVTENSIINYTNQITFDRGLEYYKNKVVEDFQTQVVYNPSSKVNTYSIDTWVKSRYNGNFYNVKISFNDKAGFTGFYCSCPDFQDHYRRRGICKHTVAALLKYFREEEKRAQSKSNNLKIQRFAESIKNSLGYSLQSSDRVALGIKYGFDKTYPITSWVEIQIIYDKNYSLRSIGEFLEAFENNKPLELGKNFIFHSKDHRFTKEEEELLEILLEINEINRINNGSIRLVEGKRIYLTHHYLKRIFSCLKHKPLQGEIQGKVYSKVFYKEEDMPLEFNLKEAKNHIIVEHHSLMPLALTKREELFFYKGNIYRPTENQLKIYSNFYNYFKEENSPKINISYEERGTFSSYILPSLKDISYKLHCEDRVKALFFESKLEVKAFIDRDGDRILCRIIYSYGEDIEINPLQQVTPLKEEMLLVRDIKREMEAINLVKSLGFKEENREFVMEEEERILTFLTQGAENLQHIAKVYYSESFKAIKVYRYKNFTSNFRLLEGDMIEVNFSIEGLNEKEVSAAYKAFRENKRYYKLKKGGFVYLEQEELKKILEMEQGLLGNSSIKNGKVIIPKYKAFFLKEFFSNSLEENEEGYKEILSLINSIYEYDKEDLELPPSLENTLREYQKSGFKWFKTLSKFGFGGILADDMGLGKTLQTIAFILSEKERGVSLIICPTSLVYNWKAEIDKFAPELKTLIIQGDKDLRQVLLDTTEKYDVVITSYGSIKRDIGHYNNLDFQYCFLDEAQNIKNPRSLNAMAVKNIKAKGYFALTGTPIENSLSELWSLFDFIMPGYFNSYRRFSERYDVAIVKHKEPWAMEELSRLISPFILRRTKKQVAKELPEKIENRIIVDMTEEQKKVYYGYLANLREELNRELTYENSNHNSIKFLSAITRLRQICVDPSLIVENYKEEDGKFLVLKDILLQGLRASHKIVVFSQFTSALKNLGKKLQKLRIPYLYLDGTMEGKHRLSLVEEFNQGETSVFLVSLKAGGVGLNLTSAEVVVHYDPWWNPAVENQATDRCHRIGQKNTVEVIKLICKNTIEEKVFNLQEKKKDLISTVIEDNTKEEDFLNRLSIEEISKLINENWE